MNIITLPKRIDLIKLLPDQAVLVEVGCHRGYFAIEILNTCPVKMLYCVDPWVKQPSYGDPLTDTDHEDNLRQTLDHLRGHRPNQPGSRVKTLRMTSLEAAATFPDASVSASFIDANHRYDYVLADLRAWSRVVKPDGWLMGHDWCDSNPMAVKYGWGVEKAVAQFCAETDWRLTHVTDEEFASFGLRRGAA